MFIDSLPFGKAQAEMGCTLRQIGMVEIVRLHAVGEQGAEQLFEYGCVVVDVFEQDGLRKQDRAAAREAEKRLAYGLVDLLAVVDMHDKVQSFGLGLEQGDQFVVDPVRSHHRCARVEADDVQMWNRMERGE